MCTFSQVGEVPKSPLAAVLPTDPSRRVGGSKWLPWTWSPGWICRDMEWIHSCLYVSDKGCIWQRLWVLAEWVSVSLCTNATLIYSRNFLNFSFLKTQPWSFQAYNRVHVLPVSENVASCLSAGQRQRGRVCWHIEVSPSGRWSVNIAGAARTRTAKELACFGSIARQFWEIFVIFFLF